MDIREVKNKLDQLKTEKENLEKENVRLHERCDQLYKELLEVEAVGKKAEEELKMTFVDQERLKKENAHLHQYLDKTEEQKQFATTGKRISEVKERQQRRKLRELKTAEEKSLWFAKTIGLNLSSAQSGSFAANPFTEFHESEIDGRYFLIAENRNQNSEIGTRSSELGNPSVQRRE